MALAPMPCPYELVPVHDPQDTYAVSGAFWAEPDLTAAAAMLARLSHRNETVPPRHFAVPDYANLLRSFTKRLGHTASCQASMQAAAARNGCVNVRQC